MPRLPAEKPAPPGPVYDRILTGHFRREKRFAVVRPQGTSDWLAIYTVSGRGRFGSGAGRVAAGPGDFFVLAAGAPHDYGGWTRDESWQILWAHFHPPAAWRPWLRWPEARPGLLRMHLPPGRDRDAVKERLLAMHAEALRSRSLGNDLAMNALEGAILVAASLVGREEWSLDLRVRKTVDFLGENMTRKFSLAEAAAAAGLSTWRLAHLFHAQMGETPRDYHERLRLEHAAELLRRTGATVSQVAYSLGFGSEFYFSRRFKKATGRSPKFFRRDARGAMAPGRAGQFSPGSRR